VDHPVYFWHIIAKEMIEIPDSFGEIIRRYRKERKLSLQTVAKATNVDVSLLSKVERGLRLPSSETVEKLADLFQVSRKALYINFRSEKISEGLRGDPLALEILKLTIEKIEYQSNIGKLLPMKEDLIPLLMEILEPYPIKRAWLFGAYVRDEQDQHTKLQIVLEYSRRVDFMMSLEIKDKLEKRLKLEVDINEYALMKFISEKEFEVDRLQIIGD